MPATVKQIIERAMRSLGVLAQGEQLEAALKIAAEDQDYI